MLRSVEERATERRRTNLRPEEARHWLVRRCEVDRTSDRDGDDEGPTDTEHAREDPQVHAGREDKDGEGEERQVHGPDPTSQQSNALGDLGE